MSTSTKLGPAKLSISQISSRECRSFCVVLGISQKLKEFKNSSVWAVCYWKHFPGAPVPLGPACLGFKPGFRLLVPRTARTEILGRAGMTTARHRLTTESQQNEKTLFCPYPRYRRTPKSGLWGKKCRCNKNLGAEPLVGFFQNLAKRCGLFISCEIQTMLSTILRKWIDVKWYLRTRPVAKLPHQHRQISRKSFLQTPWLSWYNINLEVWNHWHDWPGTLRYTWNWWEKNNS